MKTLIIIILFFSFTNAKAQYQLVEAFPNLPAFAQPTDLVNSGDGTNKLFLVQQAGIIYVFNNSSTVSVRKVFLDLTSKVAFRPYIGLLGLAFHPNYANNRYFYVNYTFDSAGSGTGKYLKLSRFTTSSTNSDLVLANSERTIYTINYDVHAVAGAIKFGTDGFLYATVGEGSDRTDSAQNLKSMLGKMLRIDVNSISDGRNYSIPSTNPYRGNTQGYKEEIYACGFRNAWKFSIDKITGMILIGDNGAHDWEEIDLVEPGNNFGWPCLEGTHLFGFPAGNYDCNKIFTQPFYEYGHSDDLGSVIGGYIYRGTLFPALYGKYIYGDFNSGKVFALDLNSRTATIISDGDFYLSTLGEDQNNELYFCGYQSPGPSKIYKLTSTSGQTFLPPVLTYPTHKAVDIPLNITFTWEPVSNADSYLFSLGDSARVLLWEIPVEGTSYTIPVNLLRNSTNYSWALKSKNATQTSAYGGSNYFKTIAEGITLLPPELLRPPNGSFGVSLNVTLEWFPVGSPTSYLLNVSNSEGEIIHNLNVTGNSYQMSGLLSSTAYTWNLRAINLEQQSEKSPTFTFTTIHAGGLSIPLPPVQVSPLQDAIDVSLTPLIQWTASVGATSYLLSVEDDVNESLVINLLEVKGTSYQIPSGILRTNTRYEWAVKSKNSVGISQYGSDRKFTTRP